MAELSLDIVAEVVEACKAGAEEAGAAFGRALDAELQLSVGEPGSVDTNAPPEGFDGSGLAVVLTVGATGAVVVLPESSGLLPTWYGNPDPTGRSKLATVAQELGMLLLPEEFMPDDFKAARVGSLSEALVRGGVSDGAAILPLDLQPKGSSSATAYLVWPAAEPAAVFAEPEPAAESRSEERQEPGPSPEPELPAPPRPIAQQGARTVEELPAYTRSLLRIKLPVVVTLARKRQPVKQILELGPGSIIQFEKSCEQMLDLDMEGHPIATGEAVKVGEKFGLRITSITLPGERFEPIRKL